MVKTKKGNQLVIGFFIVLLLGFIAFSVVNMAQNQYVRKAYCDSRQNVCNISSFDLGRLSTEAPVPGETNARSERDSAIGAIVGAGTILFLLGSVEILLVLHLLRLK